MGDVAHLIWACSRRQDADCSTQTRHIDIARPAKNRGPRNVRLSRYRNLARMPAERRVGGDAAARNALRCFPVSVDVDEPAIASVVMATGATIAATAAVKSMFRNIRFLVSIPPWPF
jgi:hypothetical protein